jgi:hypothetical protein
MIPMEEVWRSIKDFPLYEVSNFGQIANVRTDYLLKPSLTMQGDLKVGLCRGPKQYTRSLKVIVAETFIEGHTSLFNTPIVLDGDQFNIVAHNLMWRPRWFAINYTRQFKNIHPAYYVGPIIEMTEDGIILGAYDNTIEIGVTHGLLFADIWRALHRKDSVFPTDQRFAFANQV